LLYFVVYGEDVLPLVDAPYMTINKQKRSHIMAKHYMKLGKLSETENSISKDYEYSIYFDGVDIPVVEHCTGGGTRCFKEIAELPMPSVSDFVAKLIAQNNTFINKSNEIVIKEARKHRQWFLDKVADDTGVVYLRHDGFSEAELDGLPAQKVSSTRSAPPATATASGGPE